MSTNIPRSSKASTQPTQSPQPKARKPFISSFGTPFELGPIKDSSIVSRRVARAEAAALERDRAAGRLISDKYCEEHFLDDVFWMLVDYQQVHPGSAFYDRPVSPRTESSTGSKPESSPEVKPEVKHEAEIFHTPQIIEAGDLAAQIPGLWARDDDGFEVNMTYHPTVAQNLPFDVEDDDGFEPVMLYHPEVAQTLPPNVEDDDGGRSPAEKELLGEIAGDIIFEAATGLGGVFRDLLNLE
jgi:hypothetical protein